MLAAFDWLVLEREAIARGELWRLWSGHFAHLDVRHAALNLVALAVLALIAWRMRHLPSLLGQSLLMMPVIALALLLVAPTLQWYVGLSGLLHAWAAWLLLQRGGPMAIAGLFLLAAKLAWEMVSPGTAGGLPAVTQAHRVGALTGLVFALPVLRRRSP